ncbi:Uncharacterized protein TCM_017591 [Theobroma cacao]|uniref:Uncharacterized protein n=1 Tax=Theobroma cacao TaxID=3641 RepID=A0A061EER8_THECC|nr:Uncharacterized protein TCM_017591 [Theobroma cacao]
MPKLQEIRTAFKGIDLVVWIVFPNLRAQLYEKSALMVIAKAVGHPLLVDEATANGTRPSIARVCIEFDCQKPLLDQIWIVTRDRSTGEVTDGFMQKVEFERLSEYCMHCCHVGHSALTCIVMGNGPGKQGLERSKTPAGKKKMGTEGIERDRQLEERPLNAIIEEDQGKQNRVPKQGQIEMNCVLAEKSDGFHRETKEKQSTGAEGMHVIDELNKAEQFAFFSTKVQIEKGEVHEQFHEQGKFGQTGYGMEERVRTEPKGGKPKLAPAAGTDAREKELIMHAEKERALTLAVDWPNALSSIYAQSKQEQRQRVTGVEDLEVTAHEKVEGTVGPTAFLSLESVAKQRMGANDKDNKGDPSVGEKIVAILAKLQAMPSDVQGNFHFARVKGWKVKQTFPPTQESASGKCMHNKLSDVPSFPSFSETKFTKIRVHPRIRRKRHSDTEVSIDKILSFASDKAVDMGENNEDSDEDAILVNFVASWERERYY